MPGELPLILERAKALDVKPILGVRVKLSTQAGGHWTESGGDRSIFGLNTAQIIEVVDLLSSAGMLDCLQLLHYHLGSQIPNIREIRTAVQRGLPHLRRPGQGRRAMGDTSTSAAAWPSTTTAPTPTSCPAATTRSTNTARTSSRRS